MPKIIEDLEHKILDTALHLFTTESYNNVDMRRIAKETGIATGTLYNYFSSKQELLLAVFEHSWSAGFRRLKEQMAENAENEAPVSRCIRLLYHEFRRNKPLGMIRMQLMMPEQIQHMKQHGGMPLEPMRSILENIEPLFRQAVCRQYHCQLNQPLEGNLRRILEMLPMLILPVDMMHTDTPEENIRFLQDLIQSYIATQIV